MTNGLSVTRLNCRLFHHTIISMRGTPNVVPIAQREPQDKCVIHASEFVGVPVASLRCVKGIQVQVNELVAGESFEGMIYSNEFPAKFSVRGRALPDTSATSARVSGKLNRSPHEISSVVSDRQFMLPIHGTIQSIRDGLVHIVTEIFEQSEESEPKMA